MNMENISEEDSAMIETQEESHELEMEDQQIDINHLQNIFEKDVNENRKHKVYNFFNIYNFKNCLYRNFFLRTNKTGHFSQHKQ